MSQILLIVHVVVSLSIIALVMMQQGKGADAGAAFGGGGGGSSGSLFGASGAGTFLSRTTAVFAVVFFSTSMGLAFLSGHQEGPVDLMDIIPAIIDPEFTDIPIIEGATEAAIEEIPVAVEDIAQDVPMVIDPDNPVEQANELPVIEPQADEMPEIADDIPAIDN